MKNDRRMFEIIMAMIKGAIKKKGLHIGADHIKHWVGSNQNIFNGMYRVRPKINAKEHAELIQVLEAHLAPKAVGKIPK